MNKKYDYIQKKYQDSPKGVLSIIYRNQLTKQKRKNIKISYTYEEFKNRFLNDKKYLELYNNWIKSGKDKNKKPSFDRIDNKKGYEFSNLQLITWEENNAKGRIERHKQVLQFTKENKFLRDYDSIIEASKANNISHSNISACCKNKLKSAGGFIWKYK